MRSEADLRELLADIETLLEDRHSDGPTIGNAFLGGLAAGLSEALDNRTEKCGNPSCTRDHYTDRQAALKKMRADAAAIRARRATQERANRQ